MTGEKTNDWVHKIISMEIYIRYNSAWNFRETYAEHYLGDSVKKYGNLFDSVSGYWSGCRISNQYVVYLLYYLLEYRRYFKQMESYEALRGLQASLISG